jgi:hypothetical protein
LTCERKNSKASKEGFLQVLQTADKSTQKDWTGVDFVLFCLVVVSRIDI